MLKNFKLLLSSAKDIWKTRSSVPWNGPFIDDENPTGTPLEQRVTRLEKGRDKDWEFLCDYIDNLRERVEKLEGGDAETNWEATLDEYNLRGK